MIYICSVAQNHAPTIGLLLWKIRQIFAANPREYQFLIVDDASTDGTAELLEPYQRALPMTLVRHERQVGYAASVVTLLREALHRTDRPKRDAAVLLPADFASSPEAIPQMLKRLDSGADLVVGERAGQSESWGERLVHHSARWLLRPGVRVAGVSDLLSGFYAFRLVALKRALDESDGPVLQCEDTAARAELVARAAAAARQIAVVPVTRGVSIRRRSRRAAFPQALNLYRAGRRLRIPRAEVSAPNGARA